MNKLQKEKKNEKVKNGCYACELTLTQTGCEFVCFFFLESVFKNQVEH
jgi:hypothetical protein